MFKTFEQVTSFIEDFEACRLPRVRWTHEAHLTAGFWYAHNHAPPVALNIIRERIRRHNESVGTANTDSSGYHETITRLYMIAIARHIAEHERLGFEASLGLLLRSPLGDSTWPLTYYSEELLFSVAARRNWVAPDIRALDEFPIVAN